ncbi:hypothetical protein GCM10009836_39060 [Pseudonocardia ailaonensis]|uniref:GYD domain-containing protein n=1 Tax=Pseudonocardia ailaonensis TaxID=367279 RepID=A0ABN2N873_9PSEU
MPVFAARFRYDASTWSSLVDSPSNRTPAVARSLADAGAELQDLWFAADDLSGLAVFEAPDAETATTAMQLIESSGAFSEVRTVRLFSGAELPELLVGARQARPGDTP